MQEEWRQVVGWEGLYEISNLGKVRSIKRSIKNNLGFRSIGGGEVKPFLHKGNGYLSVNFTADGNRKQLLLHRLVLEAFVGPCPKGMEGCHNDGNRENPKAENLRWDTRKNNHADKKEHGTWQGGEASGTSRLTEDDVRYIRSSAEAIADLACRFNVSKGCIEKAKYRSTWRHI